MLKWERVDNPFTVKRMFCCLLLYSHLQKEIQSSKLHYTYNVRFPFACTLAGTHRDLQHSWILPPHPSYNTTLNIIDPAIATPGADAGATLTFTGLWWHHPRIHCDCILDRPWHHQHLCTSSKLGMLQAPARWDTFYILCCFMYKGRVTSRKHALRYSLQIHFPNIKF